MTNYPLYGEPDGGTAKKAMSTMRSGLAWNNTSAAIAPTAPQVPKAVSKQAVAPPPARTSLDKWKDSIRKAATDKRWNAHDQTIKDAIATFDAHLGTQKIGYVSPSFNLMKAMVWTESGGPDGKVWNTKTIQIGVPGDPGLKTLIDGAEGAKLIIPPALKPKLATDIATPSVNIAAGIAYVLTRHANKKWVDVPDKVDKTTHSVKVVAGDSLDKIARHVGTTIATLKAANPGADRLLRPGQTLTYTKVTNQLVIESFMTIDADSLADRYNGGGDPDYAEKLKFCLSIIAGNKP